MAVKVTARGSDWVVCLDQLRPTRDGNVVCPISGTAVDLHVCATCHWLEDADQDRFASWTCEGDIFSSTPVAISGSFVGNDVPPEGAPAIELL